MTDAPANRSSKLLFGLIIGVLFGCFSCCGGSGVLTWYALISYERFTVPQNGMYPGVRAGSSFIAVKKPYASAADVKRGDVVIFTHNDDGRETTYVWRVVGLPGDRVQTTLHSVSINGKKLPIVRTRVEGKLTISIETNGSAPYEVAYEANPEWQPENGDIVVPDGHFFVMGDNRHHAGRDSRIIGTIEFKSIRAKKW